MRSIESIVKDIANIYQERGKDAEEYLGKARKLEDKFGSGFAIVYFWFYSVPQRWSQVEPKIFELMRPTNSFDLNTVLQMRRENVTSALRPLIFYNEISLQLRNFCRAIKYEYSSWDNFVRELREDSIFSIFRKMRLYRNIRLTFKNLAAMKSFIGINDDIVIPDVHVASILGMKKAELNKYRTQERLFNELLIFSREITKELKRKGFQRITMIKWSLAIWFYKARMDAKRLLKY